MKKLLAVFLFYPLCLQAQKGVYNSVSPKEQNVSKIPVPVVVKPIGARLVNDTLYTTSGYKMYKGLLLHIGEGTGKNTGFRYLKHGSSYGMPMLKHCTVLIDTITNFRTSTVGNYYVFVKGTLTQPGGATAEILINLSFDKALEEWPGQPAELIVPEQYITKHTTAQTGEE